MGPISHCGRYAGCLLIWNSHCVDLQAVFVLQMYMSHMDNGHFGTDGHLDLRFSSRPTHRTFGTCPRAGHYVLAQGPSQEVS